MARITFDPVPTIAPTGAPAGRENISAATPEAFGGLIAGAEQKLGQGIESVGEAGLTQLQAKQHLTNEISASETNTWLAKNLTDKFNDFGRLQGKAAQDALPQFKDDTEKLYEDSIKNAGDNLQMKAMLAKSGRFLTDAYYRYGTNHADTQWRTWQNKTADDRANEYGNQAAVAAQHGTWDEVDGFLGTSDDEVRKKLEAQGYDRESISSEVAKRRGGNVKTIVETLAAKGDYHTAEKVYDTYQDKMDAHSRLQTEGYLRTGKAQRDGTAQADVDMRRVLHPETADFLKSRSGSARVEGVRPEFAERLTQAAKDYEAQTGGKARFESLKRTTEEQAALYYKYTHGQGGLAAPPGQSRHERGEAGDIPDGPFLDWMHQNGGKYGLEFLKGKAFENDSGHVQLTAGRTNLESADQEMHLTPQEKALYQRHLTNLTGPGGVDNPNGSRSTLFQMSFERDGKTYNIPTVWDGKILKPDDAIKRAEHEGLDKFPSYASEEEAEARYGKMHAFMERDTAAYQNRSAGNTVRLGAQYSGLPPKSDVLQRGLDRFADNPAAQNAYFARVNKVYAAQKQEDVAQLTTFRQRVDDTTSEALRTGAVALPIPESEFIANSGVHGAPQDYASYVSQIQYGVDRHTMEGMSEADQRALVEARAPTPGQPGYADDARRQDDLGKAMREIQVKRRDDPAGAVGRDATVIGALSGYDKNKPETFRPVATARLAAQEALGIDPEYRSPITKDEALGLTAPLRTMLPGQERDTLMALGQKFQQLFGDDAERAFAYALRAHKVDTETAQTAARIIKKLGLGKEVTPGDAGDLDSAKESAAADRAVTGTTTADTTGTGMASGTLQWEAPDQDKSPVVPPRAIEYLLANPGTAAAFDKQFGKAGLAKDFLAKYSAAGAKPGPP